jgi:magnesium chelatase family protein
MLIIVNSATIRGIEALPIQVEIDAAHGGLPGEVVVGLPDAVIRESKSRIKSAIKNSGLKYPMKFYTINLAPADLPKEGTAFDVPIAIGILQATDQVPIQSNTMYVGELSLNGDVRPVRGVISICEMAKKNNISTLVIPYENYPEAKWISGVRYVPVKTLTEIKTYLETQRMPDLPPQATETEKAYKTFEKDLSEVNGQLAAKRVLEIAAAGHHNILFIGPPGSGKTMLLSRLPSIMPPLTESEAIEVFKIQSIASKTFGGSPFSLTRPFRSPHHSVSYAGLAGGGTNPSPGEISLAHNGILFLDEFPEFPRRVIEVLRQPLEDKKIVISRANAAVEYPANCLLVAAMNPCPCGYYGDSKMKCVCLPDQIRKYWKKISGPILDRIDLVLTVPRLNSEDFALSGSLQETSMVIQERVICSRNIQYKRSKQVNANMGTMHMRKWCQLDTKTEEFMKNAVEKGILSGRSYAKTLKVARTIADLAKEERIQLGHICEAMQYRRGIYQE